MIVCHCEQVTQRTIKHAIADGAASVSQVSAVCGAARNCGGCTETIEELLARVDRAPVARHVPRWRRHLATKPA